MKIRRTTLPEASVLYGHRNSYDYMDSFTGKFMDRGCIVTSADVGKAFFTSAPKWVEHLLVLRNKIVGVFGLKTPDGSGSRQKLIDDFKCEVGEQLALFKVLDKTPSEVILGEDDKHLNFRVSLFLDEHSGSHEKDLIITTTVEFNNVFGRLYFLPVKPFHKIIVPKILKGILRNLENKTEK